MRLGTADLVFVTLVPVCAALEALVPRVPGHRLLSRQNGLNLVYLALKAVFAALAGAIGAWLATRAPHAGLAGLPLAAQCAVVLVVVDLKQYLVHRLTHAVPWLWRLHKVHHSTPHLNWLAVGRTHLLDFFALQMVTNALLAWALAPDADAWTLGYAVPSLVVGGLGAHLNVDWPGPRLAWISRLVVTPNLHAHHHGLHRRAVNLAEILPVWDQLFGTFEAPPETPRAFGLVDDPDFPRGLLAQQLSPFGREAA